MRIIHVLQDGREISSIYGQIVSKERHPEIYEILNRRLNREKNSNNQRHSPVSDKLCSSES